MYLLKSDLPPTVLVYLNELNLKSQSPAWLMLAHDHSLSQWGGSLEYYGISNLQQGQPAETQLQFLTGLLPLETESLELPNMATESGIYADIHLFTAFGCTWVLLVDTTAHAREYQKLQQRGNEILLNLDRAQAQAGKFATNVFTGLSIIAFTLKGDALKIIGDLPEWFRHLFPEASSNLTLAQLRDRFPFLDNFLIDAEAFWSSNQQGTLGSGIWIETTPEDQEIPLESIALALADQHLLFIKTIDLSDDELQSVLQKARDNVLNFQKLARTEAALRKSEARQKALLGAIPDLMLMINRQGEILDYSAPSDRKWAVNPKQFPGKNVAEFLSEETINQAREQYEKARQTGELQVFDFQYLHEATTYTLEARFIFSGEEEVLTIIRDVTELRRAQEAEVVRRNEQYFRSLVESGSDIIIVMNDTGGIKYQSPSMKRVLGHELEQQRNESWRHLVHPDDQKLVSELRQTVLDSPGVSPSINFRMQHRDGSWRFVEAVANNLLHQPEINGIVVTLHDITERKLAEEEQSRLQASLQRSETMAAMGTLVSGVAHEVRNPLFSISATLDALEAKFQHQADHQPYLQALRGETDRLNRLMNDLLQYGKPRQLELTKVSLRKVVEEATQSCQPLAQQQQITISNLLSEEFNLNADEERLHQVFKNLIENALQHSAKGSSVEINAERAAAEHAVTCTVRDHGNGFLPEDLGKVFDPFYSRRKGGTGLGLSIVQRIIEEHKGQITTSNHPDGGAVISVTLPLAG